MKTKKNYSFFLLLCFYLSISYPISLPTYPLSIPLYATVFPTPFPNLHLFSHLYTSLPLFYTSLQQVFTSLTRVYISLPLAYTFLSQVPIHSDSLSPSALIGVNIKLSFIWLISFLLSSLTYFHLQLKDIT